MDKYEKIRLVGRGASGVVYLYRRKNDDKLVIIKQIPVEQMSKDERIAALNEGKVLSMLQHPNIIEYFESFLQDKAMMIVMEYAQGGTLADYLRERDGNLLEENEVLFLFVQILLSLQHVHSRQILHRDLKTQNILLNKHKNVVKIGDFGISKILSSKSKAYTIVGTPSYISPELCEGKPYNQKSDIWALGCILCELITLKRAFEATTLPALILKILSGTVPPMPDHYSEELKQLVYSLLHLDPNRRPSVAQILAQPILMNHIGNFYTDFGMLPTPAKKNFPRPSSKISHEKCKEKVVVVNNNCNTAKVEQKCFVFCWGGGINSPVCLPNLNIDSELISVTVGRTEKLSVASSGQVILWEESVNDYTLKPKKEVTFIPRLLDGLNALNIIKVACRDLFTVYLSDRGILLTSGTNVSGCLGHGDDQDLTQPRIIESLLGYEVIDVASGSSHVVAITNDHETFCWGCGHDGRLGTGSEESFSTPQKASMSKEIRPCKVYCGIDCSVLLTAEGHVISCGSNRDNKLWLGFEVTVSWTWKKVKSNQWKNESVREVALGASHSAILTYSGALFMSGSNRFNQLVQDDVVDKYEIKFIACGDAFTVVVTSDNKILCWGKHSRGRLGCETNENECNNVLHEINLPVEMQTEILSLDCAYGNTVVLVKHV